MVYLDNAATTRVDTNCAKQIYDTLTQNFANPSSLYSIGFESQKVLEAARKKVADAVGCKPEELYFTASGTESNNLAVLGAARARKQWGTEIVVSGYEHPSVENAMRELEQEGFMVHRILPDENGIVSESEFLKKINKNTALAAVMRVNNEIGSINNVEKLALQVKSINKRTAFHCDNVQGFLKHPLKPNGAIDTISISAHKIHGPKGIGALYIRKGMHIAKTIFGGLQEQGFRSGTENLAYCAGFACAAVTAEKNKNFAKTQQLNQYLRKRSAELSNIVVNSPENASPYIFNFSLLGYRSETLLHFLEQQQIFVSSGSACSKNEKSHTLTAMGLDCKRIDSAIRVSFCDESCESDVDALIEALKQAQKILVKV